MAEKFRSTCWQSWQEWTKVYEMIFSYEDLTHQDEALKMIDVWRSRGEAKLPVAVECTYLLVAATKLSDERSSPNSCQLFQSRLAIAMALVRFVNGMVDQVQKGLYARSVHSVAEELGIPDWLVDLRHDATHSSLPATDVLHAAADTALAWLKENYWEKTYAHLNYIDKDFQEDLHKFLNEYMCGQWPSGIGGSKVISNLSPELGKKLCSPEVIRCYLLPELFKESVLIPTQYHLQELIENGSSDPIESFVDLWRPLLLWIHEISKHFFSELLNFVLNYLERYPMNHFKMKFLNRLLIRFLPDVQPSSRNKILEEKLLHYCLQNPTPEALTIVGLLNIDENQLVQLKNLWKVVEPFNDIICSEKINKSKGTSDSDEKELSRYFSRYPVQDCGLQLEHQVDTTSFGDGAMLKSWSLTESNLNRVKAGSVLGNLNEIEGTLSVLPDAINAYVPVKKPSRHSQEEIDMLDADESTGQVAEKELLQNDYNVSIF